MYSVAPSKTTKNVSITNIYDPTYYDQLYDPYKLPDSVPLQKYEDPCIALRGMEDPSGFVPGVVVKFLKTNPRAQAPIQATSGSAGWDLTACSVDYDITTGIATYFTGIAVSIPRGYVGLLYPRSSIYKKAQFLTNSVGVIDSDYRGEIMLKMRMIDTGHAPSSIYKVGDRVGQLVITPVPHVLFVEVSELDETERGTGGYGSTGN